MDGDGPIVLAIDRERWDRRVEQSWVFAMNPCAQLPHREEKEFKG